LIIFEIKNPQSKKFLSIINRKVKINIPVVIHSEFVNLQSATENKFSRVLSSRVRRA